MRRYCKIETGLYVTSDTRTLLLYGHIMDRPVAQTTPALIYIVDDSIYKSLTGELWCSLWDPNG